jgi:hypothetical protein
VAIGIRFKATEGIREEEEGGRRREEEGGGRG